VATSSFLVLTPVISKVIVGSFYLGTEQCLTCFGVLQQQPKSNSGNSTHMTHCVGIDLRLTQQHFSQIHPNWLSTIVVANVTYKVTGRIRNAASFDKH
jgi:hypothetical protein